MILDTNAVSGFADGSQTIRERIRDAGGPFLAVIVLGEYRFGLLSSREEEKRLAWLAELLRYWKALDITKETAAHYAEIRQRLKQNATPISSNDTWIAALARQFQFPIISNDPHFDLVPGVERVSF